MDKTITRTTGQPLTGLLAIAAGGRIPGGGYRGTTDELDKTVADAAKLLSEAFGLGVEIRFNSDSKSGGAFLKSQPCSIGITAKLWDLVDSRAYVKRSPGIFKGGFAEFCRERGLQPKGKRHQITVSVYVGHEALKDLSAANQFLDFPERTYLYLDAADIGTALGLIGHHAKVVR